MSEHKRLYPRDLPRVREIKPYRGTRGFDGYDPDHAIVWFGDSGEGHVYDVEDMPRLINACLKADITVWDYSLARKMHKAIVARRN